jgi:predicted nucleotidyltransferase
MTLRAIPSSMDPVIVAKIDARLAAVERDQHVAIPLAVESGSRAWGFPSPDSDYDCRFIYVRRMADYLALFPPRDVIETPLDAELDVNGWDLAKALRLLLKGNAVVIEWLMSPIHYSGDAELRASMTALARRLSDRDLVARHYLHTGEQQLKSYLAEGQALPFKKLFYALRPAAALRWFRLHPGEAVPPMHMPDLILEAPPKVRAIAQELIARKAVTRELGQGALPAPIADFMREEFALAREVFASGRRPASPQARAEAQDFFLAALSRYAPP